ncbi:NADH-quinone oxidoreductase subunit B family protein [Gluconacetobacter entanii]|uniref:Formate hydrogenlyase n=1 Tax=Gluconacetobacter entanii TaxID=108528 RepID=A0A318Q266_9PROT|nr:formate hydrogenlyase [Gluconacetobacter entanii]MCE2577152.1 formate hydrogenlyase [Komagataeibacter sp. FNDCR1]PYD64736.1 formate hydrogenlyase [Gluconacetobacter entanii]
MTRAFATSGMVSVFFLETGGCAGCAMELAALGGVAGAAGRAGIRFVRTPRHADILLVAGPVTRAMVPVLEQAWQAMPGARILMAIGDCAIDGGVFGENYAVLGGLRGRVHLDMSLPGCPPSPDMILSAITRWVREVGLPAPSDRRKV